MHAFVLYIINNNNEVTRSLFLLISNSVLQWLDPGQRILQNTFQHITVHTGENVHKKSDKNTLVLL